MLVCFFGGEFCVNSPLKGDQWAEILSILLVYFQSRIGPELQIIRCDAKKISKFGWKFYLTKGCPILFKLWNFLDKVPGNNKLKF